MATSHTAHTAPAAVHATGAHSAGHGADHDTDHTVDRSGWILIPLLLGVVLAVVILSVVGINSDVPDRTTPIGANEEDVERREIGMVGEAEHTDEAEPAESDAGH